MGLKDGAMRGDALRRIAFRRDARRCIALPVEVVPPLDIRSIARGILLPIAI
jgi:hypothetical protein